MPERYSICATPEDLKDYLKVEIPGYQPRYNAAPSQLLPVITNENPEGFSHFYWGTSPQWAKNRRISLKLINAPQDQLMEKPSYRRALTQSRCVIPADGFYAWKAIGKKSKVPHRIILNQNQLFCMAGLWQEYQEEDGEVVHTFMIITVPANRAIDDICPTMPAIIEKQNLSTWLQPNLEAEEALACLHQLKADTLGSYTVSPHINSLQNDNPSMIKAVPAVDQHGNFTLFS